MAGHLIAKPAAADGFSFSQGEKVRMRASQARVVPGSPRVKPKLCQPDADGSDRNYRSLNAVTKDSERMGFAINK
jgi:hypothetical protein